MSESRIVLFPYGQPVERDKRDACLALVIHADGDLGRILDGPWDSDPASEAAETNFLRYVSRIAEIANGSRPPLVVLTRSNPLPLAVLAKRRRVCAAIKNLNRAIWTVFVDPVSDPFFCQNANKLGAFDVACDADAPESAFTVWTPDETQRSAEHERYAVWSPQTACDDYFKARLAILTKDLDRIPPASVTQARLRALTDLDDPSPLSRNGSRSRTGY